MLAAVAGNSSSHLGTAQLAQLLGMLIDGEASQLLSGRVFWRVLEVFGAGHSLCTFGQSKVKAASPKVALFISGWDMCCCGGNAHRIHCGLGVLLCWFCHSHCETTHTSPHQAHSGSYVHRRQMLPSPRSHMPAGLPLQGCPLPQPSLPTLAVLGNIKILLKVNIKAKVDSGRVRL